MIIDFYNYFLQSISQLCSQFSPYPWQEIPQIQIHEQFQCFLSHSGKDELCQAANSGNNGGSNQVAKAICIFI